MAPRIKLWNLRSRACWLIPLVATVVVIVELMLKKQPAIQLPSVVHAFSKLPQQASLVQDLKQLQAAASIVAPDLFKGQLTPGIDQYLPGYKNPCWAAQTSKAGPGNKGAGNATALACLPYVFVSGFYTGIQSLISKLNAHPNVITDAGPLSVWGVDWGFWSEYRYRTLDDYLRGIQREGRTAERMAEDPATNIIIDGAHSTFPLYWAGSGRAHTAFSDAAVACWAECDKQHKGPAYEQCMDTKCLPRGRAADHQRAKAAGIPYKDLQLPMLIRAVYGARPPRLITMVRDPVERMYANYLAKQNMWERYGNTSAGFAKFVAEQLDGWQACLNGTSAHGLDGTRGAADHAPHTAEDCYMRFETLSMREEKLFYHGDQLFRGLYAPYLVEWLRFLPPTHILVLKYEDLVRDAGHTVTNKALAFLGLPLLPPTAAQKDKAGGSSGGSSSRGLLAQEQTAEGRQLAQADTLQMAASSQHHRRGLLRTPVLARHLDPAAAARVMAAGPIQAEAVPASAEPMQAGTRRALMQFYEPYNRQLAQLLNDPSIADWNKELS